MERHLCPPWRLAWQAVVNEARLRRKEQRLSQRHLAALANVSQPTISRFELVREDIQLSSVLAILNALGMLSDAYQTPL